MLLSGSTAVVTGAARGIGRALARRFATEGATVVVVDIDESGAAAVAAEIGGHGAGLDCTDEPALATLVDRIETEVAPIDLWCGNAGVGGSGGVEVPDDDWQRTWDTNVMAHVYAARHLVPRWTERGGGHLLITASAAGLLTNLGTAPYAVTKHAAVALAEWLAITHGDDGIRVSCLCPQGVNTDMIDREGDLAVDMVKKLGVIEPEQVADEVVEALADDRFLILPHPEVAKYEQRRAADRDRWLSGMRQIQRDLRDG